MKSELVSVLDLGGSKAAGAQWTLDAEGRPGECSTAEVTDVGAQSLQDILAALERNFAHPLNESGLFCIAAAGVFEHGAYHHERYSHPMDVAAAQKKFGWSDEQVIALNDTEAQTYWLCQPLDAVRRSCQLLYGGSPEGENCGAQLFLAVGTGLGVGFKIPDRLSGKLRITIGRSEGGHLDLPWKSPFPQHDAFMRYLEDYCGENLNRCESVLSGDGIAALDRFLNKSDVDSRTVRQMIKRPDRANVVEAFNYYLGQAIRNYSLLNMTTGGVFLWGGPLLRDPEIIAPEDKSRCAPGHAAHRALLDGMLFHRSRRETVSSLNVYRVLDKTAAIKGCLAAAMARREQLIAA